MNDNLLTIYRHLLIDKKLTIFVQVWVNYLNKEFVKTKSIGETTNNQETGKIS